MSKQTRYHLNALILLVLLGAATAADAQVEPQTGSALFRGSEEALRARRRSSVGRVGLRTDGDR